MSLSGQLDLSNAKENVALPSNTDVASFTDTNLSDTASSFTATIDWGDGTTTTGTVVGSNGHFTVEGGHTYADENFYPGLVTITRTADSSQLVIAGTIPVADTDTINPQKTTITFTPNAPLTNVTVATFTDPTNPSNPAGDFVAQIDWGDGTTTTGTVQGSAGSFSVVGSHTYTAAGEFAVAVSIADDSPDAATGFITSTAVSGFGAGLTSITVAEGTALTGAEVATFADTSGSHAATDYTANIDWGDGSTTTGTVSGSGQNFTVTGSHTYADEEFNGDAPLMKVVVTRTADSATAGATGTVTVTDADFLTMHSQTVGTSANQALTNVTVATFNDSYLGQVAGDLEATIDWGDGSTVDVGTISGSAGSFTVKGSHTYAADGRYNVNVSILDDLPSGEAQIGAALSTANVGLAPGTLLLTAVTEGDSNSHNVATFNDGNPADAASAFTASIDWGDGTTTGGTISGASGAFTVSGVHAYADEGDETPVVIVTRTADGETATITGDTVVGDADGFVVTADNFGGNPGVLLNNVQVATFTDTFVGQVAGDLDATINWGDGTSSAGTVSGGGGSFTVTGSHTYATGGNYTFNVSVADDPPGTATASANGTATINLAGQVVLTSAIEGTAVANGTPVATFSDSNGGDTTASFTAKIDWGDGTTSTGTVSGGGGTFTVSGGHTYTDEGNTGAKVVLTRTADGATSTASGAVAVAEGDVLVGHPVSFTTHAHQTFAGTVATFGDATFPTNVPGDFLATIDWGDGTTTSGTVSGGSGTFTVSGTHAYASQGQDTVTVTLRDDAPGTASATVTSTATVGAAFVIKNDFNGNGTSDLLLQNNPFVGTPDVMVELLNNLTISSSATISTPSGWHVEASGDFNHDNKADIILQNNDGLPQIWFMNGTSVTSTVNLPNSGPSWHVIATGDFNADGNTDILWQAADGTPDIWEMNGTTIINAAPLPNSGPSWHVIGTGDFNGDGKSDILWQNADGTPDIWLMNGTTIIGAAPLPNSGPSWHVIGSGDFNGDGNADILWQNDDGLPVIWEMNGTTIIGAAVLPNSGPSWHVIGTSDFNGDGKADIIWQNNDGTPVLWEMNGGSIIGAARLPNPGPTWQVKDDGPIPFDPPGAGTGTQPPAMHLSAPDGAVAGLPQQFGPDNPMHLVGT
jgi:hypothetical protein